MGYRQHLSVRGGCHHLRQCTGLEQADYAVFLRVYYRHGRRFLGVYVITAAVIRNPQESSPVGEGTLHRLAHESIRILVLVAEFEQSAGRSPQSLVFRGEVMAYHLDFLVGSKVIDNGFPALQ